MILKIQNSKTYIIKLNLPIRGKLRNVVYFWKKNTADVLWQICYTATPTLIVRRGGGAQ